MIEIKYFSAVCYDNFAEDFDDNNTALEGSQWWRWKAVDGGCNFGAAVQCTMHYTCTVLYSVAPARPVGVSDVSEPSPVERQDSE